MGYSAYEAIGEQIGLSGKTVRTAFSGKAITEKTAQTIARHLKIDEKIFQIKPDQRGLNKTRKVEVNISITYRIGPKSMKKRSITK